MAEAFGHRWTSQFGDEPLETWAVALRGLDRDQLAAGLRRCLRMGLDWPPGAGSFRTLCLQDELDLSDGAAVAARMPASRRLPEPPERRAERRALWRAHRAKWDEILGGRLSERRRQDAAIAEEA